MNPYDFVPVQGIDYDRREKPLYHNKLEGNSGLIRCRLKTLTPLFIGGERHETEEKNHWRIEFYTSDNRPAIPGSSLKGLFRSVAEAVAGSCMVLFQGDYKVPRDDWFKCEAPKESLRCNSIDRLCITCRLFGAIESKVFKFKGKVGIGDARLVNDDYEMLDWLTLPYLARPKPWHRAFYLKDGLIRGRKLYYHQKSIKPPKGSSNVTVQPINNAVFEFDVTYQNLTDPELSLLLYALTLEPAVCHKLGMGKPVGLGSVKIEIIEIKIVPVKERYLSWKTKEKALTGEELAAFLQEKTRLYLQMNTPNLAALRRIWQWPPLNVEIAYPDRYWFNDNPRQTLDEYQEGFMKRATQSPSPANIDRAQKAPPESKSGTLERNARGQGEPAGAN